MWLTACFVCYAAQQHASHSRYCILYVLYKTVADGALMSYDKHHVMYTTVLVQFTNFVMHTTLTVYPPTQCPTNHSQEPQGLVNDWDVILAQGCHLLAVFMAMEPGHAVGYIVKANHVWPCI